jgi:hypothetical protein
VADIDIVEADQAASRSAAEYRRGSWTRYPTDAEALRIFETINRQGYAAIDNYVSEDELAPVRAIATDAVRARGGEYVCFTGPEALTGSILSELPQSAGFVSLCQRLYELATDDPPPGASFYQTLRCLQGTGGQSNSLIFHYDSYVLTALLPVAIPTQGLRGDLLVFPSARPIRRTYLANFLDKTLIDNRLAQVAIRTAAGKRRFGAVAIPMQPGTIYFFWGYRSIHANAPCDPDKLRATAQFFYGDPHRNCRTRNWIRGFRGAAADPSRTN